MQNNVWESQIWKNHVDEANLIPGWETANKNDLIRQWVEYNRQGEFRLRDEVFSAIILKYWHKIGDAINKTKKSGKYTFEDGYEWLVETLLYVLDKKVWENESSELCGNPNGPDIAVTVRFNSVMCDAFKYSNYNKHMANFISESLDSLEECGIEIPDPQKEENNLKMYMIIKSCFNSHKDLDALVLYALSYNDEVYKKVDIQKDGVYTPKVNQIASVLSSLDVDSLAKYYGVDPKRISHISSLGNTQLKKIITEDLKKLKKDTKLKECLPC